MPVAMKALQTGIDITFSEELEKSIAELPDNYTVTTWELKRTRNYGSDRYNTTTLTVNSAHLGADKKTVTLTLSAIAPVHVMEITYTLRAADGTPVEGVIQNTIHTLE